VLLLHRKHHDDEISSLSIGLFDTLDRNEVSFNANNNSPIDVNLLAQEMRSLSVEERDRLCEEIHGVAGIIEETPELLKTKLGQMRKDLSYFSKKSRKALDRAYFF
jgi:hypothetical protein